jgi:hypothetical protein
MYSRVGIVRGKELRQKRYTLGVVTWAKAQRPFDSPCPQAKAMWQLIPSSTPLVTNSIVVL